MRSPLFADLRRGPVSARRRQLQRQRMECAAALAGGITHDLNNVFAPIIITGQLLLRRVADAETRKCLEIMLQCAGQGTETLRQVLTFAGGMEGEAAELRLAAVLEDLGPAIRGRLPSGATLEVEADRDLWAVSGDAAQVRQAILNLGLNGAEALEGGGRLSIGARNLVATPAMVRGYDGARPGPHVLVAVTDTGGGIPSPSLDRVFEPFYPTPGADLGRGLALSTVYAIVRGHGGFIQVRSKVGRGTEFDMFLPAMRPSPKNS